MNRHFQLVHRKLFDYNKTQEIKKKEVKNLKLSVVINIKEPFYDFTARLRTSHTATNDVLHCVSERICK